MNKKLEKVFQMAELNLTPRRTCIYHRVKIMVNMFEAMKDGFEPEEAHRILEVLDTISSQMYTTYDLHALPHYNDISNRCRKLLDGNTI